jgi:anti-sigma regulatory factor (Ser/Thr protein kinase)
MAQLLASELATNAIIHAHSGFEVVASESHGVVHVEVSDESDIRLPQRAPKPLGVHGRGLYLLQELSTSWGVTYHRPGKTVWFDLQCMVHGQER